MCSRSLLAQPELMRSITVVGLVWLSGCGLLPTLKVETNSSGSLRVAGDDNFDTSTVGIGLVRVSGTNASACSLRLFDTADSPANNALYEFSLSVGRTGKLAGYDAGVEPQGASPLSNITGSFRLYTGSKHTERIYAPTSGTVTITRFDAERIVGTFDLTGERYCAERTPSTCHARATGTFDGKNVDCIPPI